MSAEDYLDKYLPLMTGYEILKCKEGSNKFMVFRFYYTTQDLKFYLDYHQVMDMLNFYVVLNNGKSRAIKDRFHLTNVSKQITNRLQHFMVRDVLLGKVTKL